MEKDASPIKEITHNIIKQLSTNKGATRERIDEIWQKAAGKRYSPHTQPVSFRKKRLVVNVDSSGWLYELTMKKDWIAQRLSRILKDDFKELRFRIGEIDRQER